MKVLKKVLKHMAGTPVPATDDALMARCRSFSAERTCPVCLAPTRGALLCDDCCAARGSICDHSAGGWVTWTADRMRSLPRADGPAAEPPGPVQKFRSLAGRLLRRLER